MGWLTDLLKEVPTTGLARQRIAIAEEKVAAMEAELDRLRDANAQLAGELAAARQLVPHPDFVEVRGVLFKRKAGGGFEPVAYCPDCKRVLSSTEPFMPMDCSKCGFMAPFNVIELPKIVAGLPII